MVGRDGANGHNGHNGSISHYTFGFSCFSWWRDYCGVARWHDLLATKDMGWLQGKRDVTLSDFMLCHMLMMYIQVLSWSQVVCILVFELRNFPSHLDIWTVHIRQWDGTCFFFLSIVHLSSQAPSVDLLDVCFWGRLVMLVVLETSPTDQHHPILMLTTLTWRLHLLSSYLKPPYWQVTHHLLCRCQEWDSFQILEDGSGHPQRLMQVRSGQRVFRSRMTTLDETDIIIMTRPLVAYYFFILSRTIGGQKHTATLSPPHINPEPPNLKTWNQKGVVARLRKGRGPSYMSLPACTFAKVGSGLYIQVVVMATPSFSWGPVLWSCNAPIISHSQGRPLKDAAWYSNPCGAFLYIISILFVHVQGGPDFIYIQLVLVYITICHISVFVQVCPKHSNTFCDTWGIQLMGPDGKGHGRNWTGIYGLKFGSVIRILMVFKIGLHVWLNVMYMWGLEVLINARKFSNVPEMCASRNFQMLQSRGAWVSLLGLVRHVYERSRWGQLGRPDGDAGKAATRWKQQLNRENLGPIAPVPSHLQ